MLKNLAKKVFGDSNEKEVRRMSPVVEKVNAVVRGTANYFATAFSSCEKQFGVLATWRLRWGLHAATTNYQLNHHGLTWQYGGVQSLLPV
jgi:hypothetical protein